MYNRSEIYFSKLLTADHPSRIVTIEARNPTRPPMPASTWKSLLDTILSNEVPLIMPNQLSSLIGKPM